MLIADVGAVRSVRSVRAGVLAAWVAALLGCASGSSDAGSGASAGTGGGGAGASTGPGSGGEPSGSGATGVGSGGSGGLDCFSTEATCDGKCVDLQKSAEHCGECVQPCAGGPNATGECVAGECLSGCVAGYVDDQERAGTCSARTSPTLRPARAAAHRT
ncbi:MAG: hypothetical protein WKG00_03570 [Polyangiaceae bacterium]